jgi:putative transposase
VNEHWFVSLAEATATIAAWRVDYNTVRPYASLVQQTPATHVHSRSRVRWPSDSLEHS